MKLKYDVVISYLPIRLFSTFFLDLPSSFMQIKDILSERFVEDWPSYHLIYEWEDVLSDALSLPIVDAHTHSVYYKVFTNRYTEIILNMFQNKWINKINNLSNIFNKKTSLSFELNVRRKSSISSKIVPIIIDFWKHTDLISFYKSYSNCDLVLISSLEVVKYLQQKNCPLNIAHLPLSLPDKYRIQSNISYHKIYSVLFAGRANKILLDFMNIFVEKYPETEFLQQKQIDDELYYISNKRGIIGKFHSREEYMNLLRASKISFYSTPGIDGGEIRTGGFNPVTPRYLELISAQCLIMGRYPQNAETDFYELNKFCPNINSYAEFEETMLTYLKQDSPSLALYQALLDKHYTSCRAQQLAEYIN